MGKKSDPVQPAAPDPWATAAAQTKVNTTAATTQANLNRIDQVTPQGNLTYTENGTNSDGTPKYVQTTTLNPDEQAKYDQNNKVALALDNLAGNNISRVADAQSKPFTYDGMTPVTSTVGGDYNGAVKQASDAVYKQAASRLDPQWANNDNDFKAAMAAQGISENSDAYRRAQTAESQAKNDAYTQANYASVAAGQSAQNQGFNQGAANATLGNSARQQQIEQAAYLRNIPINDIATLLGTGAQVASPDFSAVPQVGVAAPDYQGMVSNNYNAAMSQYQQQQQAKSNMLGSIFGAAGTAAMAFSDMRLKENIKRVGVLANGLATYAFNYIGDAAQRFGVMAQEVLFVKPEAVSIGDDGYMRVDYRKVF